VKHTIGSDNIFADLGVPDADEYLGKADLAREIIKVIDRRGMTQAAAASLLGIDQPKISLLKRGKLDGFSMDRLVRFLTALEMDLEVRVIPRRRHGRLFIASQDHLDELLKPASFVCGTQTALTSSQEISDFAINEAWTMAAPLVAAQYANEFVTTDEK
jgi:predicted XRE-type DNA-binding protein